MPADRMVELSFSAYSLETGELVLDLDGHEVARFPTTPTSRDEHVVQLKLVAGRHRLVWRFTGRVVRPTVGDGRRLGFAVENMNLSLRPLPDSPQK